MSDLPRSFPSGSPTGPFPPQHADNERAGGTVVENFKLDVPLHDLLMNGTRSQVPPAKNGQPLTLPTPVFPQYPKLMEAADELYFPEGGM